MVKQKLKHLSDCLERPCQIAVFRALQLGDLLCAVPALRSLRAAFPQAEITLVGLPWARRFVERYQEYLDHFIEFPGYPGLPERSPQIQAWPAFLQTAQDQNFDLAIQLHGQGTVTNPLTVLLGAEINAGFYHPGGYCPDPETFLPYPEQTHEVHRHLQLMEFLGISLQGEALEFPLDLADQAALAALPQASQLVPAQYVCVHPGASIAARQWSPQQFAQVSDALSNQGFKVVLTGTATEASLTETVAELMHAPSINLAGQTDLGALGALLHGARLLVSNDTGVSHLAAALQVPSVVIFSNSDPRRWAPLDRDRHRVVHSATGASTAAVLAQVIELLTQEINYVGS